MFAKTEVTFWDCRLKISADKLAWGYTEYGPRDDSGHLRVIINTEGGAEMRLCLTYAAAEELAAAIRSALDP